MEFAHGWDLEATPLEHLEELESALEEHGLELRPAFDEVAVDATSVRVRFPPVMAPGFPTLVLDAGFGAGELLFAIHRWASPIIRGEQMDHRYFEGLLLSHEHGETVLELKLGS